MISKPFSDGPVLQSVHARGTVSGLLFELFVEQHYLNAGGGNIEAVYTFPVPWNAVLLGVELVIGTKVLQGAVAEKADAERTYESAIEEGNTSVMVERGGDGIYTVNVGNLLPGERAIFRFRYAQLLSFNQGQIRLVVPTAIAPRYGDPHGAGLQPHQAPTTDVQAMYRFSLVIDVTGEMARAAFSSPSHRLSMRSTAHGVTVSPDGGARLDRDFVIVAEGLDGKSLSSLGRDGDAYVALASFCPGHDASPCAEPINVKILVDCSGSMNGDRIAAARLALHEVLGHLDPADSFSFSRFGTEVWHGSGSLLAATPRAVAKASDWVGSTHADMGGTETNAALVSTFALGQPIEADVLLITDGDVWDTERIIASARNAGQRIFAIGIGSAPASSLLNALAARSGGACELVAADSEIQGAIVRMFRRMRQSRVRAVTVQWDGNPDWQTTPDQAAPSGVTMHCFARFADRVPTRATLGWRIAANDGAHALQVAIDATLDDGDTLARVAATMRMDACTPAARHALALRYGLIGATTNLILVQQRGEAEKPTAMPALRTVAHSLPAGWGGIGNASLRASVHAPARQPAVWRRESASNDVNVMQRSGVETYDVPAFLRRSVDESTLYLYRSELRSFVQDYRSEALPASLDELSGKVPDAVVMELRVLVDTGLSEHDVVRAFVAALARQCASNGLAERLLRALGRFGNARSRRASDLERQVDSFVLRVFNLPRASSVANDVPAWLRRAAD